MMKPDFLFYLNQAVALLLATTVLDGGRTLVVLLSLLLLMNVAVYLLKLKGKIVYFLPYLLAVLAVVLGGLLWW